MLAIYRRKFWSMKKMFFWGPALERAALAGERAGRGWSRYLLASISADAGQLQFHVVKTLFYKNREQQPKRPQYW